MGDQLRRRDWTSAVALAAILALAAALRLWHLDQNGYGRTYYAAAVRSMMDCWHCFIFNAFDPAGFVSLDKPPVSMWVAVLSAKAFGFSRWSVLAPQAVEGLAAIGLLYWILARRFGRSAGLVAALALALTPISVAVDRSNNTESCLVLVLLLAAWAALRAAEARSPRMLAGSMALAGIAFNVKMAAALVPVPAFLLAYWLASGPGAAARRFARASLAVAVLVAVSLSWAVMFDLTPPQQRPYAGSTHRNSMLELALLHNGVDRFVRPPAASPPLAGPVAEPGADAATASPAPVRAPLWDQTPVGPLRLATPRLAAQFAWLLPLAAFGLAGGLWSWRREQTSTGERASLVVWGGWAVAYAVVFSGAGGVFHTYYLAVLAPAFAALAGIGWALAWRAGPRTRAAVLAAIVAATAAWQAFIGLPFVDWAAADWRVWLLAGSASALLVIAVALLLTARDAVHGQRSLMGLALLAALASPLAWSLSTVLVRPNVAAPAADILAFTQTDAARLETRRRTTIGAERAARQFVAFLEGERRAERFLVAVPNALQAAPLIVRTGQPVMAMGGYLGRDPILAPGDLAGYAARGELRFVLLGGFSLVNQRTPGEEALAQWVRAHGTPVDPALWRYAPARRATASGAELYDLRPRDGAALTRAAAARP